MVQMCRAIKQNRVSAHEDIEDERVEVLGPDAAVLVTRSTYTVRLRDGRTTRRPQVVTTVWSRRSGEWRRMHLHESWQAFEEPPRQAGAVPRFEVGPCPFERRAWADAVTLECGRLIVPESRARPAGRTLRLAVAILRAPEASLPPLVMLQGGPGLSGLDTFLPAVAGSPLPRLRDVVVYDQRGAGHSEPALCPDYNRLRREALAGDAGRSTAVEREAPVVRACLARLRADGIDPAAYTTAESAADLADLRQALGYPSWDVYGNSYGARQALAGLAVDPEGVRSAVLDRPLIHGPQRAEHPMRIQRSLNRLFAACAADADCRAAFPDPAADLEALVEQLETRPITLPQSQPAASESVIDGAVLIHALAGGLNARPRMGRIPLLLHELRSGDSARAAREIAGWAAALSPDFPATLSIMPCNDEYSAHALAVADSVLADVSPAVRSLARIRSIRTCGLWMDRVESAPLPTPTGSRTPVLIIVGEYDTSGAPPEDGRRIAALLENATLVVLPAHGHAVSARPVLCIQGMMFQFWQDPTRPVDTSCLAGMPGIRLVTRW
jgi:pimeloyl-ACP methyl ester carboxylesterase